MVREPSYFCLILSPRDLRIESGEIHQARHLTPMAGPEYYHGIWVHVHRPAPHGSGSHPAGPSSRSILRSTAVLFLLFAYKFS